MEEKKISYGKYVQETSVNYTTISYNDLTKNIKPQKKITLRRIDIYNLIKPYISVRFIEQISALLPLSIYLVLFQLFVLQQSISDAVQITSGMLAVILGLMFFMEGIKQGLMPLGEMMGNTLPKKITLVWVLFIAFLLGVAVTFAEPAIGALKAAGAFVPYINSDGSPADSIYLYALLNIYTSTLVLLVGVGVGFAAVLGTIRFIKGWSLKPYIYIALTPVILLTLYFMMIPQLAATLGLAWDSGAVTTGPVTVPLVLALGIGIASSSGQGDSKLSGFGIVTLASLFPILVVMLLTIIIYLSVSPDQIITQAKLLAVPTGEIIPWYESSPGAEIIGGMRSILPLVIFLLIIMKIVLKSKITNAGMVAYGVVLAVLGMCIFNIGLTYGLSALGAQAGGMIPAAFSDIIVNGATIEQLYPYAMGIAIAILFAWILGFGATLAEPALGALGATVEDLTNGVFKKKALIYAVSVGVGTGIAIGIIKIIFNIPLGYLLLPAYGVAVILTYFSSEEFVNIAWDSAGVTTGPITVPLVLAMGLGIASATGAMDGFGILSMASIGPIISVQATGLFMKLRNKKQETK